MKDSVQNFSKLADKISNYPWFFSVLNHFYFAVRENSLKLTNGLSMLRLIVRTGSTLNSTDLTFLIPEPLIDYPFVIKLSMGRAAIKWQEYRKGFENGAVFQIAELLQEDVAFMVERNKKLMIKFKTSE